MTIAILATGDEIVHGDTLNTNSQVIAHTLTSEGLVVGSHLSCSDNEQDMLACLEFLSKKHDIIISIGGLGPTSDDRTRFAIGHFLNVDLVEFPEALTHIKTRLERANLNINLGNRQQALFPARAVLLPNPFGTAMGCYYNASNKRIIMLPGPPRECLPMFHQHVLPILQQTQRSDKQILKWRLFGVAEGQIAEILDSALANLDCETGYRLETPYLEFKVRCRSNQVEKINHIIQPLIESHVIASPEQKASECLSQRIALIQEPIAIIDDVTGGVLQTLLDKPYTHRWLAFHDKGDSKLYFHLIGLEEYWAQLPGATTAVTIKYHNDIEHGSEMHLIPYFSPLVIDYAAEWLSFRLLHLIDQLHQ